MLLSLRIWIWPVWLAIAFAISVPLFRQEVDFKHPPGKLAGLIALGIAMAVWIWLRRRWPRAELALIAGAFLLPALIREPIGTAAVALLSLAALAFGRSACDWLRLSMRGRMEEIVLSAALGFSAWIFALSALGLAHLLYGAAVTALIVLALLFCRQGLVRLWGTSRAMVREFQEPDALTGMALFAILVMAGSMHLVVLAPSLYFDSYATHLAASKYFALHHTTNPMPFLDYSWLPQGYEVMMGAVETLGGPWHAQIAAQMISPVFLILNMFALYAIARELGLRRATSVAGSALATVIPVFQWTGANAKNDLMLSFFLLATLLALLRAMAAPRAGWIYAAAIFAAAALDVKLSALIYLPCLGVLFVMAVTGIGRAFRTVAISAAIFFAAAGYVPVRNKIVKGAISYPIPASNLSFRRVEKSPLAERVREFASTPWRSQVKGGFAFSNQNGTPCGFIFLLFVPAFLWIRRNDLTPAVAGTAVFSALYLVISWVMAPDLRYAAAAIGLATLGLTAGLARTIRASPWYSAIALLGLVGYCVDYNWAVMATLGVRIQRIQLLLGRIDEDQFLRQMVPSYPAMAWIRDHAKQGELTLSVGNRALAYAGDPGTIYSISDNDGGAVPILEIRAEIRANPAARRCRYLVIAKAASPSKVFEGIAPAPALVEEDENFLVFRIPE